MFTLSTKNQWLAGSMLLLAMLVTRAHVTDHMLDASWAVFILAGFYLRSVAAFGLFMAVAAVIDYVAISQLGVSGFCVSSAYVALVPAYGALFAAGRWFAGQYQGETLVSLGKLALAVVVGVAICELVSSGSFYLGSGRFADLSLMAFAGRLLTYAPHSFFITSLYVTVGAFVHVAVRMAKGQSVHGH